MVPQFVLATVVLTFERTCLETDTSSLGSMHIDQLLKDYSSILCCILLWLSYLFVSLGLTNCKTAALDALFLLGSKLIFLIIRRVSKERKVFLEHV